MTCDKCGVKAFYCWEWDVAMLLFCLHHSNKFYPKLRQTGWVASVIDAVFVQPDFSLKD